MPKLLFITKIILQLLFLTFERLTGLQNVNNYFDSQSGCDYPATPKNVFINRQHLTYWALALTSTK